MIANIMSPIHLGEVLREGFLEPLDISANALTNKLGVTPARINEIVREKLGRIADTALR
jgi:addiction module HigA family antidote